MNACCGRNEAHFEKCSDCSDREMLLIIKPLRRYGSLVLKCKTADDISRFLLSGYVLVYSRTMCFCSPLRDKRRDIVHEPFVEPIEVISRPSSDEKLQRPASVIVAETSNARIGAQTIERSHFTLRRTEGYILTGFIFILVSITERALTR